MKEQHSAWHQPMGDLGHMGLQGAGLQQQSLSVSPQIPFSDGGPGWGGHQLPGLGWNDLLRGGWDSGSHDANPISRVASGRKQAITNWPALSKAFLSGKNASQRFPLWGGIKYSTEVRNKKLN